MITYYLMLVGFCQLPSSHFTGLTEEGRLSEWPCTISRVLILFRDLQKQGSVF